MHFILLSQANERYSLHEGGSGIWESRTPTFLSIVALHPTSPLLQIMVLAPCRVHDRLLLPNVGKEAASFYDYVAEHYDSLPTALVFRLGTGLLILRTHRVSSPASSPEFADMNTSGNEFNERYLCITFGIVLCSCM